MRLLLTSLLLLSTLGYAEHAYVIKKEGVSIHVIEFGLDENLGFRLIDGGKTKHFVSDHYSPESHSLIVNGGYFDENLNPIGYFRIDGNNLSATYDPKLSGFITITEQGELSLHWKAIPEKDYSHVIQAGPYIVDPGGNIGIHTRAGTEAKRTVIGQSEDGRILFLTTTEVYLYDLARILKSEFPQLERALNLDGGPSVGLIYNNILIENLNPVRNFLIKLRSEASGSIQSEAAALPDTPEKE